MRKLKNVFHLIEAIFANFYYGFPSKKLKVIGVTGTDGKTTVVHLIYHILKSAGKKVSMVSTIYAKVGNEESDTGLHTTTPGSFLVQKLLRQAVDCGDEYFVLETTSHALDQNRVFGVNFLIGVLTNITYEHLDYHQTYQQYLETKLKLLKKAKKVVVNQDDNSYKYIKYQSASWRTNIKYSYKISKIIKSIPQLTKFNQYNYSAGYTACKVLGLSDKAILQSIKTFKLPKGRMDIVYDKDFKVIIDFAHTPNAFLQLLPEIRRNYLTGAGRLIHVFGSAGLRDCSKRPLMGEASAEFSNIIILTEEDYRTEDVDEIMSQIEEGTNKKFKVQSSKFKVLKIPDRQKAIDKAISLAETGDVVVITGKGHEKSLCRGKTEYPWDEYKAVKQVLQLKLKS